MKMILTLVLLILTSLAYAGYADYADTATKEEYCGTWASNAVAGGSGALRGKPFVLFQIDRGDLGAILEHINQVDGMVVFKDSMENPRDAAFVTESMRYGYDFVKRTPPDQLPASAQEAFGVFFTACMASEDV
jgi:hypothetical protein